MSFQHSFLLMDRCGATILLVLQRRLAKAVGVHASFNHFKGKTNQRATFDGKKRRVIKMAY